MATTSSITDEPIRTTNELEFAFFCIESVAERLHQDPVKVYNALTKDSDLRNSYIVPLYDILHTQSKQYIVDDIIEVMKSRGIDIWFYIIKALSFLQFKGSEEVWTQILYYCKKSTRE